MLSRLHRTGVRDYRPTVGTRAVRLLRRFPDGNFPDVAERRIPVRRHYAVEGLLWFYDTFILILCDRTLVVYHLIIYARIG